MAYRHKMNRRHSEKSFSRGADRIHKKNISSGSARGGHRL